MGKIKQTVTAKRKAKNKNAKYTYAVNKTTLHKAKENTTEKKYSYTKKILINGVYRYFYR